MCMFMCVYTFMRAGRGQFLIFYFKIFIVLVCVCTVEISRTAGVNCLLPPYGFQGSNSGHQVWQQVL